MYNETANHFGVSETPLIDAPHVEWRWCDIDPAWETNHKEALSALSPSINVPPSLERAVAKRRSEFLAGRLCAALALEAIGASRHVGISGRAPVWPRGVRGSISHSATRAVSIASRHHVWLGLDCEQLIDAASLPSIEPLVVTPEEIAERPDRMSPGAFVTLVFSAKEAAYKAISSALTDVPDFTEAGLFNVGAGRAELRFRNWRLPVHYRFDGDDCTTLIAVPSR